jgi:hypothetical protein
MRPAGVRGDSKNNINHRKSIPPVTECSAKNKVQLGGSSSRQTVEFASRNRSLYFRAGFKFAY